MLCASQFSFFSSVDVVVDDDDDDDYYIIVNILLCRTHFPSCPSRSIERERGREREKKAEEEKTRTFALFVFLDEDLAGNRFSRSIDVFFTFD